MYSDDEDTYDFKSINKARKWLCFGINPSESLEFDFENLPDIHKTYMNWFNNQLRIFEDYSKSFSFSLYESNILPSDTPNSLNEITNGDEESTLGNHFAPVVGRTLEFVLSQIFIDTPFKIFEIGAGRGTATTLMFKEMSARFCDQYVLTDLIYKPFDKFVRFIPENRDEKTDFIQTPFDVTTQTKISATEVIENIKKNHITNSILYICCPPPFDKYISPTELSHERYISTDLISLVKSIDVPEIKYIIIVRHEKDVDGTRYFDKHVDLLNHLHHWYLVYDEIVSDHLFSIFSPIYYRKMYVFSRTDNKI